MALFWALRVGMPTHLEDTMTMASIRSRARADGSASHQVIFRRDGRRSPQEFATFDDYAEAVRFQDTLDRLGVETALEMLAVRESGATVTTVQDWCHRHIEELTGVTEGTRVRYRSIADKGLGKLAPLPIQALSPRAVALWVNTLRDSGLSPKTIANRHGLLYAAMERARDSGLVAVNPCKETRLPAPNGPDMVCLTGYEFTRLLAHVRPDAQDLVTSLVATGQRFGEATALQVQDWDPGNRRVSIIRAWKYSGTSRPTLGTPKTKRSRRNTSVPLDVADIYTRHCEGKAPTDFIFTNSKGEPWRASNFHSSVWQPAVTCANGEDWELRRAQWEPDRRKTASTKRVPWRIPAEVPLGKRPRIHDLRHTAASWWLQAGTPIVAVSRRLGHESIKTTVDTYGHLSPAEDAAMDEVMNLALVSTFPQIENRRRPVGVHKTQRQRRRLMGGSDMGQQAATATSIVMESIATGRPVSDVLHEVIATLGIER